MPARLDDALIHQNYGTLEQVVDPDPRWFDRFYFDLQAIDGSLSIAQGIGVYPNMGVMDGFALFCLPDQQVNLRASRELVNGDRDEMDIGPLHAEILEPMKSWRFWLEENSQGATYDFTYTSSFKALEPVRLVSEFEGRRVWDWTHFGHVGRVEGWARLDGKTYNLKPETHYAIRDRSWGVRPGIAVVEDTSAWFRQANWGTRYNWCCVQLESFYLWYFMAHETDGTPRYFEGLIRWADSHGGAQEKVVKLERKLEFGEGEHFLGAALDVHLLSGQVLHVNMQRLATSIRLRGGNYGGYKGLIHGMRQGPLAIDGERWAPADARVLPVAAGITEHVVEVTYGAERGCGIFEIPYGS